MSEGFFFPWFPWWIPLICGSKWRIVACFYVSWWRCRFADVQSGACVWWVYLNVPECTWSFSGYQVRSRISSTHTRVPRGHPPLNTQMSAACGRSDDPPAPPPPPPPAPPWELCWGCGCRTDAACLLRTWTGGSVTTESDGGRVKNYVTERPASSSYVIITHFTYTTWMY